MGNIPIESGWKRSGTDRCSWLPVELARLTRAGPADRKGRLQVSQVLDPIVRGWPEAKELVSPRSD